MLFPVDFLVKSSKKVEGSINDISIGNNKLITCQLSVIPAVVVQAFSLAGHVVA